MRLAFFRQQLERVLSVIIEAHEVPAVLLLPLMRVVTQLIHKMRVVCPTVRLVEADARGLTGALIRTHQSRAVSSVSEKKLRGRIPTYDVDMAVDPDAPGELRASTVSALLELSLYVYGLPPGAEIVYLRSWEVDGKPAPNALRVKLAKSAVSHSERLPFSQREESVRGFLLAIKEAGGHLLEAAIEDAATSSLPDVLRTRSLALVTALFAPPLHGLGGAEGTSVGPLAPAHLDVPAGESLSDAVVVAHESTREKLLFALEGDAARGLSPAARLVRALQELDALEGKNIRSGPPDHTLYASGRSGVLSTSKKARLLRESKGGGDDDGIADAVAATDAQAIDAGGSPLYGEILSALAAIAGSGRGNDHIAAQLLLGTSGGALLNALSNLTWLRRAAQSLTALNAAAIGLPSNGGVDSAVAAAVASVADRLVPLLSILGAFLTARPRDAELSAHVFGLLRRHQALVNAIVIAALAPSVPIVNVRLATQLVDLLTRCVAVPGTFSSAGATDASVESARTDDLVLRLFRWFCLQPRATASAQLQRKPATVVPVRAKAVAHGALYRKVSSLLPGGLVAPPDPNTPDDKVTWLSRALVVSPAPQTTTPGWAAFDVGATYAPDSPANVGAVVTSGALTSALLAGEELAAAVSRYCVQRCQSALLVPPGDGIAREISVMLFHPIEAAAAGELLTFISRSNFEAWRRLIFHPPPPPLPPLRLHSRRCYA